MNTEILYGFHPVAEAIKANRRKIEKFYFVNNKKSKNQQLIDFAIQKNIPLTNISKDELNNLTESQHNQGVAAIVSPYPVCNFYDCIDNAAQFVLILDNIVDSQNLGAILRTSLAVGIDFVIISKDRSAKPTPSVSKSSAGAMEHMKIAIVTNIVNTIKKLKEKNFWIAGLDKEQGKNIYSTDLSGLLAIVIGGEQKGIRQLVKNNCDFLISIPQKGEINSLNASVAGAVAMYEAFRQRIII